MTKAEARKIATLIEASYIIQTDAFGDVDDAKVHQQSQWVGKSLLKRYNLSWADLSEVGSTPSEIRDAVLSGAL